VGRERETQVKRKWAIIHSVLALRRGDINRDGERLHNRVREWREMSLLKMGYVPGH